MNFFRYKDQPDMNGPNERSGMYSDGILYNTKHKSSDVSLVMSASKPTVDMLKKSQVHLELQKPIKLHDGKRTQNPQDLKRKGTMDLSVQGAN
jgi:hypothetical protein